MESQRITVTLPDELARMVRVLVERGAFASASDVVREALIQFATQDESASVLEHLMDVQEAAIDRTRVREGTAVLASVRAESVLGPDLTLRDLIDEGRR